MGADNAAGQALTSPWAALHVEVESRRVADLAVTDIAAGFTRTVFCGCGAGDRPRRDCLPMARPSASHERTRQVQRHDRLP